MRTLAVALLLVLAGCGGGAADQPSKPSKTSVAPTKATATPKPTVAPPKGTPAPEALSKFRCGKNSKDVWSASGYLANESKNKVTFQVTVYVGEAAGAAEKAKTHQVANVAAKASTKFSIDDLPAPDDGGPCHVQVLAQR
jgi:flagellar basal body L-ring protein FlgH